MENECGQKLKVSGSAELPAWYYQVSLGFFCFVLFCFLFVCLLVFSRQDSPVVFGACPGTSFLDQADLELREIRLPLPPKC